MTLPVISIQSSFPRFHRSPGNFTEGLIDLCGVVSKRDTLVEIGSFSGESAEIFAQCFSQVYCIDIWDLKFFGTSEFKGSPEDIFLSRLAIFKNVTQIKSSGNDAVKQFKDKSIDCVYIDAMHEYKPVIEDIRAWTPKVAIGGVISGHDYDEKHLGVMLAVKEVFGKPDLVFCDNSWLVRL
jgi:predicted O-methyltransferase YrrM